MAVVTRRDSSCKSIESANSILSAPAVWICFDSLLDPSVPHLSVLDAMLQFQVQGL
jgi:hypothetical protein